MRALWRTVKKQTVHHNTNGKKLYYKEQYGAQSASPFISAFLVLIKQ